ncbi:MAG: hypothetical protein IKT00_12590 [Prevotella sp.]|nr:hypothetical protein [Prevotella sp.]
MNRLITFIAIYIISMSAIAAKNGWFRDVITDDYSQERTYICVCYKNNKIIAVFYPDNNTLKVIKDYDGLKYFDTTWNALLENSGRIKSNTSSVYLRYILNNDYEEYKIDDVKINFSNVDTPGDPFFSSFYIGVDVEDMKKAKSVSFMWYDSIDDEVYKTNITLMGFTACYNSCKR